MENFSRLVFRGELQNGLEQADVIDPLARLLKISPERAQALFKARRVVLKQNLPAAQIEPYATALRNIGLIVHVEAMQPQADESAADVETAVEPAAAPAASDVSAPAVKEEENQAATDEEMSAIAAPQEEQEERSGHGASALDADPANDLPLSDTALAIAPDVEHDPVAAGGGEPQPTDRTRAPWERTEAVSATPDASTYVAPQDGAAADPSDEALPAAPEDAAPEHDYLQTMRIEAQPYAMATETPAADAELSLAAEEIACPKCDHRQAKRTLCLACGVDMPRYRVSQEEIGREERASPTLAHATSGSRWQAQEFHTPDFFSFSFEGRIGRLRYINYGIGLMLLMIPGMLLLFVSKPLGLLVFAVSVIAACVMGFRLMALRLHDVGHSGWLSLVSFVPVIGALFAVALMLWPGHRDSNEHGLPPGPNHGLAVLPLILYIIVAIFGTIWAVKHVPQPVDEEEDEEEIVAYHDAPEIVMYCNADAPHCREARAWLSAKTVSYTDCDIERSDRCASELDALNAQGVPTFVIDGDVQTGFDAAWMTRRLAKHQVDPRNA